MKNPLGVDRGGHVHPYDSRDLSRRTAKAQVTHEKGQSRDARERDPGVDMSTPVHPYALMASTHHADAARAAIRTTPTTEEAR